MVATSGIYEDRVSGRVYGALRGVEGANGSRVHDPGMGGLTAPTPSPPPLRPAVPGLLESREQSPLAVRGVS